MKKPSDEVIKFVLSLHWQNEEAKEIVRLTTYKFKHRFTLKEVMDICDTYTLRHHGTVIKKSQWVVGRD